jgi:hypothetical protein
MKNLAKHHSPQNPQEALRILTRIRREADRRGGPTKGLSKEEVIKSIKKTRAELWMQYLASRP